MPYQSSSAGPGTSPSPTRETNWPLDNVTPHETSSHAFSPPVYFPQDQRQSYKQKEIFSLPSRHLPEIMFVLSEPELPRSQPPTPRRKP